MNPDEEAVLAINTPDDAQWWHETGMCGGCGDADCHEDECQTQAFPDPMYERDLLCCTACPSRIAEGWWG